MQTSSPYSPPETDLFTDQGGYAPIKVLSSKGRIGRLRYLGYSFGITFMVFMAIVALAAVANLLSEDLAKTFSVFLGIIAIVGYLAIAVINILLTIQRCHDFNSSGWLTLLLLLPFVPLIFWFIPGTNGANSYGPPPPPNKGAGVVIVVIFLGLVVTGILAAIAIPAYEDYVTRAAAR
jgi:uncharacterized membrane protein YhaH (DUF805 family)